MEDKTAAKEDVHICLNIAFVDQNEPKKGAMSDYKARVGKRIRAYRELRGMTYKELAIKCGLRHDILSFIERGMRFTSIKHLERIAEALNIAPEALFTDAKKIRIKANELTLREALKVVNKFFAKYELLDNVPLDLLEIAKTQPEFVRERLDMVRPHEEINLQLIESLKAAEKV